MEKMNEQEIEKYRVRYQKNCEIIRKITIYLRLLLVSVVLMIIPFFLPDVDEIEYLGFIGILGTVLFSCLGANVAELKLNPIKFDGFDGAGCLTIIVLPVYILGLIFTSLTGWFFSIKEKNRLIAENAEIAAKLGDQL